MTSLERLTQAENAVRKLGWTERQIDAAYDSHQFADDEELIAFFMSYVTEVEA